MKKVLITGGAGFIGFYLAKRLAFQGQNVTVCDNLFRGKSDDEFNSFIKKENVTYVEADLTDTTSFEKLDNDYDYVYHLAAINGTKNFYEIPDKVLRVNILTTLNLLDWFATSSCGKLLFSSSSETYAGTMRKFGIPIPTPENVPLCIDDVSNERWSYGGSKIAGELLCINYGRVHGFKVSIIRYHNIYAGRMGYEHVLPEFSLRIVNKEDPFTIFGGDETRAFCFIDDAIEATQLVMESDKTNSEIVHIGNDLEEISIKDLAKRLFKIAGVDPKIEIKPAPKGCVPRRCPDISKLKKLTGFEPKICLDEGLKKIFEWYKNNLKS